MRRLKLFLFIFFILIILSLLFFHNKIQPNNHKSLTSTEVQELSQNEYKNVRDTLVGIVDKQDPRVALALLREKATTSEAITRSCHDLTHEIGHEAYDKYHDFAKAMQYQDELCNSGYLHGIIESHFAKAKDIFATMQTICSKFSPTTFIGWECFHGVGHGLMYFSENDVPKSLTLCDTYTNAFAAEACVNGVFMENFNTDQKEHISHYLKASDPFYPCTIEQDKYKNDCYLYAPVYFLNLHKNQYIQALNWCKTAKKDYQLICITGVGSQAIKENIKNPKFVESQCMQVSTNETKACIQGMVGLYINHFGGLSEARQLCGKLEQKNQSTCKATIKSEEGLF